MAYVLKCSSLSLAAFPSQHILLCPLMRGTQRLGVSQGTFREEARTQPILTKVDVLTLYKTVLDNGLFHQKLRLLLQALGSTTLSVSSRVILDESHYLSKLVSLLPEAVFTSQNSQRHILRTVFGKDLAKYLAQIKHLLNGNFIFLMKQNTLSQ